MLRTYECNKRGDEIDLEFREVFSFGRYAADNFWKFSNLLFIIEQLSRVRAETIILSNKSVCRSF